MLQYVELVLFHTLHFRMVDLQYGIFMRVLWKIYNTYQNIRDVRAVVSHFRYPFFLCRFKLPLVLDIDANYEYVCLSITKGSKPIVVL